MIMDYGYTTRLCLNGHSITCEDRVFDIYSDRYLLITDCVGTGKVETTGNDCTIGNNKYLSVWGGTILNSGNGPTVHSYSGTTTYICGGRVEVTSSWEAIYCYPGSKVYIQGGTVYGGAYAINGNGRTGDQGGFLNISGGTISCEYVRQYPDNTSIGVQDGDFIMSGGYVEGSVDIYEDNSATVYTNQGLTPGVTYYYKVRAFATDGDGKRVWSGFSGVDYMPAAVVFNDPYSNSTERIRLRWYEISGAHGYQIWRLDEDGQWKIVKTLGDKGNTLTNDQGHVTACSQEIAVTIG